MEYSKYQQDFFTEVIKLFSPKNDNIRYIVLAAVAGSGKTFSIVESIKKIPPGKTIKLFAFNKSIATELESKTPTGVDCSTVHSFGCKAIYRHLKGRCKVDENKNWSLIEAYLLSIEKEWEKKQDKFHFIFDMMKLLDMWRINLMEFDTREAEEKIRELILKYEVEFNKDYLLHFLPIWKKIKDYNDRHIVRQTGSGFKMDFADMVYLPVAYPQIKLNQFDIVYVDECQDLSSCQQAFCERTIKETGFGIYVGDPNQAIYGFAGSDYDSYQSLITRENTLQLPLSVCYRCCKAVVNKAKAFVPEMQPFEEQIEGSVEKGSVLDAEEGDMVLCRNVKPLVSLWFEFVGEGKKCFIKGKEIGKSLITLVDSVSMYPMEKGLEVLGDKLEKLLGDLVEAGIQNPKTHKKYLKLSEDVRIIEKISQNYLNLKQVSDILGEIFKDKESGIQLMTMHKAKGLENKTVYIVRLDLVPSKYSKTKEQLQQENNLLYVAFTRAQESLVIDTEWRD